MASVGMAPLKVEKADDASMFVDKLPVDKLPEEINEMKIRDDKVHKEMEAAVVDGNGTQTGHIIVTTIRDNKLYGRAHGQPRFFWNCVPGARMFNH